jgi:threonine/homoserine/homoserine lactone efflux protein
MSARHASFDATRPVPAAIEGATLLPDVRPAKPSPRMPDTLIPLVLFSLAGSYTPGPNTIMLTASGQAFGFRRSIPHMAGIMVGCLTLFTAFGFGLSQIFTLYPVVHQVLRLVGAAYLLYLAFRILRAGDPAANGEKRARPLTLIEAAAFQWVNVKALALAVGIMSAFTTGGGDQVKEVALIVTVFALVMLPSLPIYVLFGVAIGHLLKSERARRIFNTTMAALVALSVVLLFI